eukprot:CAMPEP_0179117052 /NCGR_PEP_ID=MMETSP0796-20121207/54949_1 /TAXON_ID=73915 /ORGANISM="Pyrodinium bahamense, Strain pbaha01" /LENGTH=75 /DNA_ID=CAMNT_0020815387 /DNA_START=366 /DNA_END=593 /DNA_ORIENTATION=-
MPIEKARGNDPFCHHSKWLCFSRRASTSFLNLSTSSALHESGMEGNGLGDWCFTASHLSKKDTASNTVNDAASWD